MKNYSKLKRILEYDLSLVATFFLLPLILLLALLIKLDSPGPVFFKQKRIGKGKIPFYILKFRTMKINTPKDTPTHMLENPESYITNIGAFLRKTSLDELPQLFNILKGEMSLVGPRPALWNQYDLINEREKFKANDIKPGITGLAQISGRDELPIDLKSKLDGRYAESISLILDMRIIFNTIINVLIRRGIREGTQ